MVNGLEVEDEHIRSALAGHYWPEDNDAYSAEEWHANRRAAIDAHPRREVNSDVEMTGVDEDELLPPSYPTRSRMYPLWIHPHRTNTPVL